MPKKKLYLMLLFISVSLILFWAGCENTIDESPTASIGLESTGSLQLSFSKASVTAEESDAVDTVTAILTRSGYESILKSLAIVEETASAVIYNVAEGTWQLTVKAKDSTGTVLYSGVAEVEIAADTTTYVVLELSAASASGNLSITVTWKEGDGINWTKYDNNPVLDLGASGEWDDSLASSPTVVYNGEKYEMWYTGSDGSNSRIGYAYSSDGINWTKYSGNPVIDLGDADSWNYYVSSPSVLYNGLSYEMWLCGSDGSKGQIGYVVSVDGINWTMNSDPVLTVGESDEWDGYSVGAPTVIYNGTSYEMWYTGYDSTNYKIGYATSTDGIKWNKYSGNPVLEQGESGEWDKSKYLIAPCVIYDGVDYMMWYSGNNSGLRIGYATSTDGINWTKYSGNPVLQTGETNSWDATSVYSPTIIFNGITYKMWFEGQNGQTKRIGYATSP